MNICKDKVQFVRLDYKTAINQLSKFLSVRVEDKEILRLQLEQAVNIAVFKLLQYRKKYGVGMEKEELLRDVVFIGTSLAEKNHNNPMYYKAVVKACCSLVEIAIKKEFEKEFIEKMLKANNAFQCNGGSHFSAEAFYFIFKTHFRLS